MKGRRTIKMGVLSLIAALLIPLIWLSACNLPQDSKPQTGTLSVTLPGKEDVRMTFQDYVNSLSFFLNGDGPARLAEQELYPGKNRFSIAPGVWSLRLSVKNKAGEEVGGDTKDVLIVTGKTAQVSFVIQLENPDPEVYVITFEDQDGDIRPLNVPWKDANKTPTLRSLNIKLPAPLAKQNALFAGWQTEDGEDFTEDTAVSGNVTLYARWSDKPLDSDFGLVIDLTLNGDPDLIAQTATASAGIAKEFSVADSGWTAYQWYQNGFPIEGATSASYAFYEAAAGVYNLTVVVTDGAGDSYSGSCLVTVDYGNPEGAGR